MLSCYRSIQIYHLSLQLLHNLKLYVVLHRDQGPPSE